MASKTYTVRRTPDLGVGHIGFLFAVFMFMVSLFSSMGAAALVVIVPLCFGGLLMYVAVLGRSGRPGALPKDVRTVEVTDENVILDYGASQDVIALNDLRRVELDLESAESGRIVLATVHREIEITGDDSGVLWALRKHLEREIYARKSTPRPSPIAAAAEPPPRPRSPAAQIGRMSHTRPQLRATAGTPEQTAEPQDAPIVEDATPEDAVPVLELKPDAVPEKKAAPEESGEEAQRWRSI